MNSTSQPNFDVDGFTLIKGGVPRSLTEAVKNEITKLGTFLGTPKDIRDIDGIWNHFKHTDRSKGGLIYNAFKHFPSVHLLGSAPELLEHLRQRCGFQQPALVDINCRIDSKGEEKYLFGWHQDYWFSVCSPNAVVIWVPLTKIDEETGGLSIISNRHTQGKIYQTQPGTNYQTYADAVVLAEEIPAEHLQTLPMEEGDALIFKFNVLHKSNPLTSDTRSRFSIQLRVVDLADQEFIKNTYKPGVVNSTRVDYLSSKE